MTTFQNLNAYTLPNNLCFGATWLSPVTKKKVTALHFTSFVDCIRKVHGRVTLAQELEFSATMDEHTDLAIAAHVQEQADQLRFNLDGAL
tara:strand:- start:93 stop:362 length:270 start_codon:yes stop_codon:yes gene_type:complete